MSEAKFTKGEWRWGYNDALESKMHDGEILDIIAMNDAPSITSDYDKSLIAAAPELYEALSDLAYLFGQGDNPDEPKEVSVARAALAKARGETV